MGRRDNSEYCIGVNSIGVSYLLNENIHNMPEHPLYKGMIANVLALIILWYDGTNFLSHVDIIHVVYLLWQQSTGYNYQKSP